MSHIVKLWYRLDGCPDKFAFNVSESLKSGFQKCGLFPFCPDVIRRTVKSHHEPGKVAREIRQHEQQQDFEPLWDVLRTKYSITSETGLNYFKEQVLLQQLGLSSGTVLAAAVQKALFSDAPEKKRRVKNSHLSTEAGALVTSSDFVTALETHVTQRQEKKAAEMVRRKAPKGNPQEAKAKKQRKS